MNSRFLLENAAGKLPCARNLSLSDCRKSELWPSSLGDLSSCCLLFSAHRRAEDYAACELMAPLAFMPNNKQAPVTIAEICNAFWG